MIEPTESVTKRDLDSFAEVVSEAVSLSHEELQKHPMNTAVRRLDEVKAARDMILTWKKT